jgi:S1-C subfamily serine protease
LIYLLILYYCRFCQFDFRCFFLSRTVERDVHTVADLFAIQALTDWSQTLKLPKGIKTGAVIMGVDAFSPAGKAGLKKVHTVADLFAIQALTEIHNVIDLMSVEPGNHVELLY